MRLAKLELQNFRNHISEEWQFTRDSVVFIGPNTAGKTNILESIYLLATGETFRDAKVEEMVQWTAEVGRVAGQVQQNLQDKLQQSIGEEQQVELEVVVTRGVVQGRRVAKRKYLVNGVGRPKKMLLGNLQVVEFRPEDMRIVEGSPARRRRYLDGVLAQAEPEYGRTIEAYQKALVRRNKLLDMIREGRTQRSALAFWDELVIRNGEKVQKSRLEFSEYVNKLGLYQEFGLAMRYEPSVMSRKRLDVYADQEILAGFTLVGPHRDDFVLEKMFGGRRRKLAAYGSRGEQRLGVLWLKMQALEYLESRSGERPVLLLDDIFSELDEGNRELVEHLFGQQQTVATTANEEFIERFDGKIQRIEL